MTGYPLKRQALFRDPMKRMYFTKHQQRMVRQALGRIRRSKGNSPHTWPSGTFGREAFGANSPIGPSFLLYPPSKIGNTTPKPPGTCRSVSPTTVGSNCRTPRRTRWGERPSLKEGVEKIDGSLLLTQLNLFFETINRARVA